MQPSTRSEPASRRVLLSNLPPSITLTQLLLAFHNNSAFISAVLVPSTLSRCGNTVSAVIEFCTPEEATSFTDKTPLAFFDVSGDKYISQAVVIPTSSYSHTSHVRKLLNDGVTRAICVTGITGDMLPFFLRSLNPSIVTGLKYEDNVLSIQFSSIIASAAVCENIRCWCMQYRPNEARRFCDYTTLDEFDAHIPDLKAGIPCIPHPFEAFPDEPAETAEAVKTKPVESDDARFIATEEPSNSKRPIDVVNESDSNAEPESESKSQNLSHLLKSSMARWELYGRVAKHRRLGKCCDTSCPYCRRIEDAPPAALVQQYSLGRHQAFADVDLRMFI